MFLSEQKRRKSFHLLTELYSFLLEIQYIAGYDEIPSDSFRLFMEYHSFLLEKLINNYATEKQKFPSPYGVSFILIRKP